MAASLNTFTGIATPPPEIRDDIPASRRQSNTNEDDEDSFVELKTRPSRPNRKQCKTRSILKSVKSLFLRRSPQDNEPTFDTLGGVFAKDLAAKEGASPITNNETSASTLDTGINSTDSVWSTWSSSDADDRHLSKGPRFGLSSSKLVMEEEKDGQLHLSENEIWGRLILRARKLPKQSPGFQNNHIMINAERTRRFTAALCRSRNLDQLAMEHAKQMAESTKLSHPETTAILERVDGATIRVATNVARGSTLKLIHTGLMESTPDKNNILDRHFSYMGIGTAKAADGTLYLCQLFQA